MNWDVKNIVQVVDHEANLNVSSTLVIPLLAIQILPVKHFVSRQRCALSAQGTGNVRHLINPLKRYQL